MPTCETCGEEYETLSRLRLDHDPCPVEERQRKHDEAIQQVRDERGLEVGDQCRVIKTGNEVEIVDIEPSEEGDGEPTVVWVPAGKEDTPERRRTGQASELV